MQDHLINMGEKVRDIWRTAAQRNNIDISTSGISSLQSFGFNSPDVNKYNSIFVSEMLLKTSLPFASLNLHLLIKMNILKLMKSQ